MGPDGKSGKEAAPPPAPDNRWGYFITGNGEFTNVGDTDNSRGYHLTSARFTTGIDYKFTPHFALGIAAGYDHSEADLSGGGRVAVDGGKLLLYGTYFTGGFYVDGAVQGGYNSYDTDRAALAGTATSSTDGGELNLLFETGYDWKMGALSIGPTGSFGYTYVGVNSTTEYGSLAPLDLASQSQDSIRSLFGVKISYDLKAGHVVIIPELRLGWQHEYGDNTLQYTASRFANGAGWPFSVQGPVIGRDSLIVGAGFSVRWSDRVSTYLYYDGELGRTKDQSSNVSGGFRIAF